MGIVRDMVGIGIVKRGNILQFIIAKPAISISVFNAHTAVITALNVHKDMS